MVTMWSTVTFCLLPPAFIMLILLTVPFPLLLSRGVVKFGDALLNVRIGSIRVFTTITLFSFIVLVAQTMDLRKRYDHVPSKGVDSMGYAHDLQTKASRWRAERNWWISALTFTIYWVLLRLHSIKKQLIVEIQKQE